MSNLSLEYMLIAGKALASAQYQSGRTLTAADVKLAVQETGKRLVEQQRASPEQAQALAADLPAPWITGENFKTAFFANLSDASPLGVDLGALEPMIAGVSATLQQALATRKQQEAATARASIPAELKTPLRAGMAIQDIVQRVEACFANLVFRQEVGCNGRQAAPRSVAAAVSGLAGEPQVQVVSSRIPEKPLRVPLYTLPMPLTIHDLALHLVAADRARGMVDELGFNTAVLGQQSFAISGQSPTNEWGVYTAITNKGVVVGIAVTNIDSEIERFRAEARPQRDAAMEARIASCVQASGKSIMDQWVKGTPLFDAK
jgi:hypothetical protein